MYIIQGQDPNRNVITAVSYKDPTTIENRSIEHLDSIYSSTDKRPPQIDSLCYTTKLNKPSV